jgi:ribosomal protein S18 acetylase RimI-like enzyme
MGADLSEVRLVDSSAEAESVARLLESNLYEFNVDATGFADGKGLCFTVRDDRGEIVAGIAGYTWGGGCHIKELWVAKEWRGRGLGRALIDAVECEANIRDCHRIMVSTHTFQAPDFYARLGFVELARIDDDPTGHANVFLTKRLKEGARVAAAAKGRSSPA